MLQKKYFFHTMKELILFLIDGLNVLIIQIVLKIFIVKRVKIFFAKIRLLWHIKIIYMN